MRPSNESLRGQEGFASGPIAIVGMACRFPGAPDLDAFWRLLEEGRNAITEGVPGSGIGRIGQIFPGPDVAGEASRFGGFLDDLDLFDPAFFRISPIEAETLDPQHRLMLETSWRALEDAGLDPDRLKGSRTGVYTGISNMDYRDLVLRTLDESPETPDAAVGLYAGIGTNLNGVSGRVAFVLGLEGPTMVMDAACASSLVAIHQAVTALHRQELDLALAGGVNVILDPKLFEARTIAGILSPDGQCKAFDASANGFVRAEGCGVVVLKRLAEALADGDRIWAVLRGSAVNHGGASVGFTVPNEPAQVKVLQEALSRAGIAPADVDYLETHGTGTPVGDPIEMDALASVYSEGRHPEQPLLIGSVKTNVGHMESAAGMAGLIKTVLAMRRGLIPRHLHFNNPNPDIAWDQLPVRVTSEAAPWPARAGQAPRAAVSSYGMSGTNAHLVLEGDRDPDAGERGLGDWGAGSARRVSIDLPEPFADLSLPEGQLDTRETRVLPLSAKNDSALRELAGRYRDWLGGAPRMGTALADVAWTASVGRGHFPHRAGLPFSDAESLRERLTEFAHAEPGPAPKSARKVAFAYTGQGGQWVGMGRDLYETEPVARAVLDRCEAAFLEETGASLLDVMFGRDGAQGDLDESEWTQPALYALDCALTALWASVGVRPDVVIGHSFGELPAAQAASVFSIEGGLRIAMARGRLIDSTERGAMAAVFAPRARVEALIEEINATSERAALGIAVDNGVNQVVTGLVEEVDAITERLEAEEVRVRRLAMSRVYHSALLEPALPDLEEYANGIAVVPPKIDFVSNISGKVLEPGRALDGSYWRRHAREPVAFADGVRTIAGLGVDTVIEIGPHAVLSPMVSMLWPQPAGTPGAVTAIASMMRPEERGGSEAASGFADAVAEAYQAGLDISFEGLFAGEERRRVSIPGYPFQRGRYWIEAPRRRRSDLGHPLLGARHESPRGEVMFQTEVSASEPAWLPDHQVFGRVVAPGALYAAMAASALLADGAGSAVVEDMQLRSPLILSEADADDEDGSRRLQLVLDRPNDAGTRRVEVFSRGAGADWTLHVDGRVSAGASAAGIGERLDVEGLKATLARGDAPALYRARANTGVDLGRAFRGLTAVWQGADEALGEVSLPSDVDRNGIDVHPLLLDACFQVVAGARGVSEDDTTAYMPFGWDRLWLAGPLPERLVCRARMLDGTTRAATDGPPEVLKADLWIHDEDGLLIGGVSGYTAKRATRAALLSAVDALDDLMYEVIWRDQPYAGRTEPADEADPALGGDPPGVWILAADAGGVADRVAAALAARNQTVVLASSDAANDRARIGGSGTVKARVDFARRESWRSLAEGLPEGALLRGVVHLSALDGHGPRATTEQLKQDVTRISGGALALVQGLLDADAEPEHGIWFVTRGGQVLEQEQSGELAGAMLWGFGKVVTRELSQLPARIIDLDPGDDSLPDTLIDELLAPDSENLVAYRGGGRQVARLVRAANGTSQLALPDDPDWCVVEEGDSGFRVEPAQEHALASGNVRVAVEAAALDPVGARFHEVCGRVTEAAPDVAGVGVGDRVLGFAPDALGPAAVTRADLVTLAPAGISPATLAAVPAEQVTAAPAIEASPDAGADASLSGLADLIENDPARVGAALAAALARMAAGELTPPRPITWPMAQAGAAREFMRSHPGAAGAVLTASPIATGRLRADRSYLVTGGLGGIGGAVAGWLADRGAGTIVLNGRRSPDTDAEEVIRSLRERGATVHVELADVADASALRSMLERIDATLPPLGGVIHSVGALSDAALPNQSWERFEEIVWAKVLGAWELHRATENRDLDLFILFSSMSGVRGNPGQANYASANAFLDQLARHRRALGLPGQTVQWGAWLGIGEAEQHRERIEGALAASGAEWMTPQQGVRALDRLVRQDLAVGSVTSMDWRVFGAGLSTVPPLIEELLPAAGALDADESEPGEDLMSRLREAPEAERQGVIAAFIQAQLQQLLHLPSPPSPTLAFYELGIDSLMAVELRARLNRALAGEYTASNTVAFDYPDTASLAAHLAEELGAAGGRAPDRVAVAPAPREPAQDATDAIAIVGIACRFPGAADLESFWRMLEHGASGVSDKRNGSGSWTGFQGDAEAEEALQRRGAFVDGLDEFDAPFFRVSPLEARNMDPQLRLLLETSWHALDDAAIDPDGLRGSRTGLYVGFGASEYRDVMTARGSGITLPIVNGSLGVGRAAFALGLEGPALGVEVACASSLVAVHHAVTALRQGEVKLALAGGVNAALSPEATKGMSDLGMLSSDGQCRAFDAAADGYVRGEGCGVVVLKRLSDALADGDRIRALIRGSAVNQNSTGVGPTAPNGLAQRHVIEEALSSAGLAPADVDYLEAHGVASGLGDAIELEAAAAVYGRGREAERPLLVGSVKTNIGHLESAAGMAGLIKTVLSMQHRVIPAQLHFNDPSSYVDWDSLPVRVTSSATDWPLEPGRPPLAAVSAFGMSGANAHLVVQGTAPAGATTSDRDSDIAGAPLVAGRPMPKPIAQLEVPERAAADRGATRLLPLSARSGDALRDLARRYIAWLDQRSAESPGGPPSESLLADAAWTAGVGRSHFPHRASVVFRDGDTLRDGLRAVADAAEGTEPREAGRVAFRYGGEAGQRSGIVRSLYESEPVVRAVLDRCEEVFREERQAPLLAAMFGDEGAAGGADREQPALYAAQCALAALWASVGVHPGVVLGDGVGELAAAHAAGVFTLEAGMRLAIARGAVPAAGANGAGADSALAALGAALGEVPPAPPSVTLVSSLTGRVVGQDEALDAAYWRRQAQSPAKSATGVGALAEMGVSLLVEIAANAGDAQIEPGLPAGAASAAADTAPIVIPGLLRSREAGTAPSEQFVRAVGRAYEAGLDVAFAGLFAGELRRRVSLPGYPFQRRRYWLEPREPGIAGRK